METKPAVAQPQQTTAVANFNFFDPVQFETMQRVCTLFANSELVPDMYRIDNNMKDGKPINPAQKAIANCMIAIEMAQRIGASPLMIMQNMVIIYGRPSWSSKFLVATVNTCGRFEPLKYKIISLGRVGKLPITEYIWDGKRKAPVVKEFDGTQIDNLQCIAYTNAKGSDEVLESAPIDIKLSIQEGWYTKAGSKWQTMTRQMLMYRAASFWTNAYAPELSMGMKTDDEWRDIVDVPYEEVTTVSEKVDKEKAESANKKVINIDDEPKADEPKADEQKADEPKVAEPVQSPKVGEGGLFEGTARAAQAAQVPPPANKPGF